MPNFNYHMPTQIFHGEGVVNQQANQFSNLGSRALLVTGKNSARLSGALKDVIQALDSVQVDYAIFDQVENNPSLANVTDGGQFAREYKPHFILGIGGGSPLDAAKAIAVLATNEMDAMGLYEPPYTNPPLSVVAIPTTAGTGSEATPYSVLTIPDQQTKKGFGGPELFPKIALLDPLYTASLPRDITVDTGVDALSHLVEAYLSKRASDASDLFAKAGIELWKECISQLVSGQVSLDVRDKLLIASTLGGMTISHTGTTFVHALGYSLTFFHDIPHGQANGLVMAEYLGYTQGVVAQRVDNILAWLGLSSVDDFRALMNSLFKEKPRLSTQQIRQYGKQASETKNAGYSLGDVTAQVCIDVLEKSLQ